MNKYKGAGKGWRFESTRHSLASSGVKTKINYSNGWGGGGYRHLLAVKSIGGKNCKERKHKEREESIEEVLNKIKKELSRKESDEQYKKELKTHALYNKVLGKQKKVRFVGKDENPFEMKFDDLSFANINESKTYLIDVKHLRGKRGNMVDNDARTHKRSHRYFRLLENGKILGGVTFGYLQDNKIIQWG